MPDRELSCNSIGYFPPAYYIHKMEINLLPHSLRYIFDLLFREKTDATP